MAYLPLIFCLCAPGMVLAGHVRFPRNGFTPFLVPRFLSHRNYPKSVFRQAGIGWFTFCAWLLGANITVIYALPGQRIDSNIWLLGIIVFAVPIIAVMSFAIAVYYLSVGVFARSKMITPGFQSIFATDIDRLDLYMKRLIRYTKINIGSLVLLVGIVATEVAAGVKPEGIVPLVNVALLITFILTTWRVRKYLVKSAIAMGQAGEDTLASALGHPLAIFFGWYYAFDLRKKHNLSRQQTPPTKPSGSEMTHQNSQASY